MTKPQWCMKMLGTKRRTFGNIVGHAKNVEDISSLSAWTAEQFNPALSWDDVARIKDMWGGKLIIKGIMAPEDGVRHALEPIYNECDISMSFCGHTDINQVREDILVKGTYEQLKSALPYIAPLRW